MPDKNRLINSLMRNKKYILDVADLQYKQVRLPWKQKLFRAIAWLLVSFGVAVFYLTVFENTFGSPKEFKLNQDIENLKLQYSMLNKKYEQAFKTINNLRLSDDRRYRPILDMDSLPTSFRNPGYGGVDRYRDLEGLTNSPIIIEAHQKLDALNNMVKVQNESFITVEESRKEWERKEEYLPKICPVDPSIKRGDGLKFRKEHPVLGTARWHFGQDFNCPYGTDVYATGNGTITVAGWSSNGFGSYVMIDHGYGYQSIYGHLSKINVSVGLTVKRGDLIGLSGNSGTSSGPHLHYQIDYNGNHTNALDFFSDDLTPEEYREMIISMGSKSKFR
jgi:murein DD-endopeptidase MepM/ murein hydrolase activator NlpD